MYMICMKTSSLIQYMFMSMQHTYIIELVGYSGRLTHVQRTCTYTCSTHAPSWLCMCSLRPIKINRGMWVSFWLLHLFDHHTLLFLITMLPVHVPIAFQCIIYGYMHVYTCMSIYSVQVVICGSTTAGLQYSACWR